MATLINRSKAVHQNGHKNETITNRSKPVHQNSHKKETSRNDDVISNGFHGYKSGIQELEKFGVHQFLTRVMVPLILIATTPQLNMLFWYTNVKCGGSYSTMAALFRGRYITSVLYELWSEISIFNTFTFSVVLGYCAWAIFWMKVLPGKQVNGPVTERGNVPRYVDNGFLHYLVTMAGFVLLTIGLKMFGLTPTVVYDRFGELLCFMNISSLLVCLFLYFKGIYFPSSSDSGKTGSFLFDFYWGTELYPRICGVDFKVFTNCRFGMTVWPLLVSIYALKSYELHGFVDSMFVTTVLQLTYITKFFVWEAGYMRTIDIILDRAGYYICWGCLCWVPALYPLISQYLVTQPVHLGPVMSSIILGLGLLSILVNYLADLQRQVVRNADGNCLVWGKRPEIIRAKYTIDGGEERESILLVSGWWGLSRHFHYIPEIMLSFFWTVTAGFTNIAPYTYVIFLLALLIHRSYRDDQKCAKKYGPFWQQYCRKVKHRIVPYLF